MTRHLVRLLLPLLIASGLVLGLQVSSEAHDNAVTGVPVCNHATGQVDVTWKVANDYNLTEVLSNATRVSSQLNGVTVAKNGTVTATESVAPGSGVLVLKVHGKWSDGYQRDDTSPGVQIPASCVKTQHVSVSATFADQTCDGKTGTFTPGTYDAPQVAGTTQTVTGDTEPGDTLTVSFASTDQVATVIDGQSTFSHTYPASPTKGGCKPPPCGVCHLQRHKTSAPAVTVCKGNLTDGVVNNVLVLPGRSCDLNGVYVNGTVRANGAHDLSIFGGTVRGSVLASHMTGDLVVGSQNGTCAEDPMIGGSLRAIGSHNIALCHLNVCHAVIVKHDDGRIMVRASKGRRLVVRGNDRFVDDGSHHAAPGAIRLYHNHFKHSVIGPNRRPVARR